MFLETMETAVLNRAAMQEVDCNSNALTAELEVKKLQELVRKLERQNEQLRTRAQPPPLPRLPLSPPPYAQGRGAYGGLCLPLQGEDLGYFEPTVVEEEEEDERGAGTDEEEDALLDELELLDLDSMCSSGDSQETWLYSSQKSTDSSDSALTPLQWCRQALNSPKSELKSSRRSLALRLEQGRSLQRSVFSFQSSGEEDDSISLGFKLQDLTDVQVMARMQEESLRQELSLPPRRSHSLGSFPCPTAGAPIGREEEEEEYSDDEDYALPLLPPLARLSHSHTFHALSSLSHWPSGAPQHPSATAGFAFHTPPSLELGSPLGDRGYRQGSDKLRRSLVRAPSMPSVPLPPSPGASPRASPCVLRSQSFDLSSGLSFLQSSSKTIATSAQRAPPCSGPTPLTHPVSSTVPPPGPLLSRVQSMGSFSSASRPAAKATAYVSPTVKSPAHLPSSPLGSSGIPLLGKHVSPRPALTRPVSFIGVASSTPRGKAAQPGRSFLTPPKSLSTLSALRDLAWRDGCY